MLKFISGLFRTRSQFTSKLHDLLLGKKTIDSHTLKELKTILLSSDVGVETTEQIIKELTNKKTDLSAIESLQETLFNILAPCQAPLDTKDHKPYVILMVGINGAGKTTSIGKLTKKLQAEGKKVMLAAGDTFRAAAIEQLKVWGERNSVPVISQHTGADSAAVIFDALQAAKARNFDVLIADTAGRLHTQDNLMAELQKVVRVMQKLDQTAPHEVMLVLDASIGQNSLQQALKYYKDLKVTGITLTKLDGSAKGGIVFAIANSLKLPIRYIGIGERIDDFKKFDAKDFIESLISNTDIENNVE